MTGEPCGARSGGPLALVCDREPGHPGSHRGYLEAHDEPLFWRDDAGPPAPLATGRPLACTCRRIRRGLERDPACPVHGDPPAAP